MQDLPSSHTLHHSCFFGFHLQLEKQMLNQVAEILRKVFLCETASHATLHSFIHFNYENPYENIFFIWLRNSLHSRVPSCCRSAKTLIEMPISLQG